MNWLATEVRGKEIAFYIVWCVLFGIVFGICSAGLMELLHIDVPPVDTGKDVKIVSFTFLFIIFSAAFLEELLFRLPIAFAVVKKWPPGKILACAGVLSAIFGYAHGSIHHVFIQGVFGFMLCVLFLKCGGMQRKFVKATVVTTAAHVLFNGMLMAAALASGVTTF